MTPGKRGRGRPAKKEKIPKIVDEVMSDDESESADDSSDSSFIPESRNVKQSRGRGRPRKNPNPSKMTQTIFCNTKVLLIYFPNTANEISDILNHSIFKSADDCANATKRTRGRPRKRQSESNLESDGSSESDDVDDDDDDDDFAVKKKAPPTEKRGRGRPKIVRTPSEEALWQRRDYGRFDCPYCVKFFTQRKRVNVHIRTRHGFECSSCGAK